MPAYLTILRGIKEKGIFFSYMGEVFGMRGVSVGELEDGDSSSQTELRLFNPTQGFSSNVLTLEGKSLAGENR